MTAIITPSIIPGGSPLVIAKPVPVSYDPYWINPGLNRTPIFKAAIANGSIDKIVALGGDSTMKSTTATNYAATVGMQIAAYLVANGVPAHGYSRFGWPEGYIDADVSAGSVNWQAVGRSAGGDMFKNDTDTADLSIAVPISIDNVESYFWDEGTNPTTVTIKADGTTVATDTNSGRSGGVHKLSHAVAAGIHTMKFARASGTVFEIGQIYTSGTKRTIITNLGLGGSAGVDWNNLSNYQPLAVAVCMAPHLFYFDACINGGADKATHKTAVSAVVTAMQGAGADVILGTPNPGTAGGNFDARCDGMRELCVSLNLIGLDMQAAWGMTYAAANALGFMNDGVHPNDAGYANKGTRIGALLNFVGFN